MKNMPASGCVFDGPSCFTAEQVFNRFCRVLERELLDVPSTSPAVQRVIATAREIMHVAPVFYLDLPEVKRVATWCSENPADLMLDPVPVLPFDELVMANPYQACLLFDAESAANPANPGEPGAWEPIRGTVPVWRCKFIMLHQEDDGWALSVGMAWLGPAHDNCRQIIIPGATLALAYTMEGDSDRKDDLSLLDVRDPSYADQLRGILSQTISMALDGCRYIDAPRHHLVVEEPRRFDPAQRHPKLPRADRRPRVRLVEPEAVRRIYPHHPGGEEVRQLGRIVTPHARRGHTKLLKSPRYKAAQGRRIVIRPTWVGDPDWEHQGIRYKVVFRKPAAP